MSFWGGAGSALLSGGLSLLGGLFGGGAPEIPKEQRQLLRLQRDAAKDLRMFSQSAPLTAPDELQALAQQRGLLGQQQRGMMSNLFAGLGAQGSPAPGDMMANLATQFQGQQSGLLNSALMNALQSRRNALLQSAQVAQGAVPAAQPTQQGVDLGGALANLAQQFAYRDALKRQAELQRATPGTTNFVSGFGDPRYQTFGAPGAGGLPFFSNMR